MRYVILKKIGDIWFATRNRYTAKELEILVDKLYDDIVDFELINDGECQGLDDGVIIVKDDDRELNKNGRYLNDDLEIETNTEQQESGNIKPMYVIVAWCGLAVITGWTVATGIMITAAIAKKVLDK